MPDSSQSFSFEKLWSELLRRRVVRVAVVYAVVGWVVIEVASTVLPPLGLPNWAVKLVIVLVALGFPIAVAMARRNRRCSRPRFRQDFLFFGRT